MNEHAHEMADENGDAHVAACMRVRVYPATDAESRGVVVDDFGETAGYAVDIGDNRIADPARRWAVMLDTGTLVFIDSDHLLPNDRHDAAMAHRKRRQNQLPQTRLRLGPHSHRLIPLRAVMAALAAQRRT